MSELVLNRFELLNWMYFKFFTGEILTVMSLISMYYSDSNLRPPVATSMSLRCRPRTSISHLGNSTAQTDDGPSCIPPTPTDLPPTVSAPPTHTVHAAHIHGHLPTPSTISMPPTTCRHPPPRPSRPCHCVHRAPSITC